MLISQREARRLRARVTELETVLKRERFLYGQEWCGGVEIAHIELQVPDARAIRTAHRLSHAVVVLSHPTDNAVRFMALPHPKIGLP